MAALTAPGRVLSVQSHVVSGYVGNRAATFPLQLLGYDVDVINTVQFSNHTGYGHTDGHKTAPDQLAAVFAGLRTNGLISYARVLTGYVPGAQALAVVRDEVARMVDEARAAGAPPVVYLLDPVMGDIGVGLYVSQDVVPIYRDMLRLATVITPNQFEAELLSEQKITSLRSLHSTLVALHAHVPHIALSSLLLPTSLLQSFARPPPPAPPAYTDLLGAASPPWYDPALSGPDTLVCLASTRAGGSGAAAGAECETWLYALPTVRGYFSGVGDLFSALVLGHYDADAAGPSRPTSAASGVSDGGAAGDPALADAEPDGPLPRAVGRALMTVQQILVRTHLATLDAAATASGTATPRPLREGEPARLARPAPGSAIPSDAELDAADVAHGETRRRARRMRMRELRIVQERRLIEAAADGGPGAAWPAVRLDWAAILRDAAA